MATAFEEQAQNAAAKERIIRHMNADHQDSIQRYLESSRTDKAFFPRFRDAQMTDISLTEMKIASGGKTFVVAFAPMKSMREARDRLVQMDKDALATLGRSDIAITTFIPPYVRLGHLLNFSVCLGTFVLFCRQSNFRAGSLLFDHVLHTVPEFVNFCLRIQPYLFRTMVGIHLFEAGLMARKLNGHGVAPGTRLWWLWVGTCLVEGITSFWRLDGWIGERKREKESKKH